MSAQSPAYVPEAVDNLMNRTANSSLHPLVKYCVFFIMSLNLYTCFWTATDAAEGFGIR